jgi:glycyl-tRNA synthetase beta chain
MVFEFPELQGIMGRIYARMVDGEPEPVCVAIEEMYQPRTADDAPPASPAGALLSIADKMDSIACCCAAGLGPTGSADPYALRRQALGMLRTIAQHNFRFPMRALLDTALGQVKDANTAALSRQIIQILQGRLETVLKDLDVRYDIVNAVLGPGWNDVAQTIDTAKKLTALLGAPEFRKACTVLERCHNITRDATLADTNVDTAAFAEPLESALWTAWQACQPEMAAAAARGDLHAAIRVLAGPFHDTLHEYFDRVMVNVEDDKLRTNRHKTLRAIRNAVAASVADLSCVVFEGTV